MGTKNQQIVTGLLLFAGLAGPIVGLALALAGEGYGQDQWSFSASKRDSENAVLSYWHRPVQHSARDDASVSDDTTVPRAGSSATLDSVEMRLVEPQRVVAQKRRNTYSRSVVLHDYSAIEVGADPRPQHRVFAENYENDDGLQEDMRTDRVVLPVQRESIATVRSIPQVDGEFVATDVTRVRSKPAKRSVRATTSLTRKKTKARRALKRTKRYGLGRATKRSKPETVKRSKPRPRAAPKVDYFKRVDWYQRPFTRRQ